MAKESQWLCFSFPIHHANSILKGSEWCWQNLLQHNLNTFSCPPGCEWYFKFCEKQWNHVFSHKYRRLAACHAGLVVQRVTPSKFAYYGQQYVSNMANIFDELFYVFFSYYWQDVSNIEDFLWKAVSSHLLPWSTGSEWHSTFCERESHHISYEKQQVSNIQVNTCFWKGVSSHLFLWPIGSQWHGTFCGRQSHHIFFYDQ